MDVSEYIKRAADRSGYRREYFVERNLPTVPSNVLAVPFYGDLRSTVLLSTLLLKTYKEAHRDKYLILCSWPGLRGLFPYVDEFWSIDDESATKALATDANNFYNAANLATELTRGLVEVLDVLTSRDLKKYYDNGFTKEYWAAFGGVRRFLPEVPSATRITPDFKTQMERRPGTKVVVYPAAKVRTRQGGRTASQPVPKPFWAALLDRLLDDGYVPVVYQNWFTHDMSRDFADRCVYLAPRTVEDVLAAFRHVGCVLDVHAGLSRLAIAARTPYLAATERRIFVEDRDYEVDDLCGHGLPRQYVFGFATHLMTGGPAEWKISVLDNIMARLRDFVPALRGAALPPPAESYEAAPYERVRARTARRLGAAFIKSSRQP